METKEWNGIVFQCLSIYKDWNGVIRWIIGIIMLLHMIGKLIEWKWESDCFIEYLWRTIEMEKIAASSCCIASYIVLMPDIQELDDITSEFCSKWELGRLMSQHPFL